MQRNLKKAESTHDNILIRETIEKGKLDTDRLSEIVEKSNGQLVPSEINQLKQKQVNELKKRFSVIKKYIGYKDGRRDQRKKRESDQNV